MLRPYTRLYFSARLRHLAAVSPPTPNGPAAATRASAHGVASLASCAHCCFGAPWASCCAWTTGCWGALTQNPSTVMTILSNSVRTSISPMCGTGDSACTCRSQPAFLMIAVMRKCSLPTTSRIRRSFECFFPGSISTGRRNASWKMKCCWKIWSPPAVWEPETDDYSESARGVVWPLKDAWDRWNEFASWQAATGDWLRFCWISFAENPRYSGQSCLSDAMVSCALASGSFAYRSASRRLFIFGS
ncbi:hypothetical protein SS50377_26188 [Spironucleus salmonicida]|uniref:Uncharacterized protein n=1 Tax=Spironucleus salmonicida TaxID=348837 RepID=A0A9P8LPP9_9EUKA|nr:hypothetical protein SS50377_26188 [Spironucleus salmonicida]